jgi:hypothetical protein
MGLPAFAFSRNLLKGQRQMLMQSSLNDAREPSRRVPLLQARPSEAPLALLGDASEFLLFTVLTSAGYLLLYVVHLPDDPGSRPTKVYPYRAAHTGVELEPRPSSSALPRVRPLTWAVVLAQVALVFALFAAVNARELFAGHALARAAGTMTYAQYLHAGFARLLSATVLAVVTVVVGHWLLMDRTPSRTSQDHGGLGVSSNVYAYAGGRALAALEVTLLALVGLALASCWQRSSVYEIACGYTYLRLGVRFTEIAVFGVIALTILKSGLRSWRGYGIGLASVGLVTVLVAACFNADLYVARRNVQRAAEARAGDGSPYAWRTLDLSYLAGLSRDATPVLDDFFFADDPGARRDLERAWAVKNHARGWRSFRGLVDAF